jgi:hypothetical protein
MGMTISELEYPKSIWGTGNPKTMLGEEAHGVLTAVQHLAHADTSGINVCRDKTAGCAEACLDHSGRGIMASIKDVRIRRTRMLFYSPFDYWRLSEKDLSGIKRKAEKLGLTPAARPNATSDMPWERMGFRGIDGVRYASLMERWPDFIWYDYTKSFSRAMAQPYHLTYSLSEKPESIKEAVELLANGINVAVVFDVPKRHPKDEPMQPLPITWQGFPVFDGNLSDVRFLDPKGHVVGLRYIGNAADDTTGFVQPNIAT